MCYGISCEVGRLGDEIMVWFGDPKDTSASRDSHREIRIFHGLPEVTRHSQHRTPIEMWPTTSLTDAATFHRHFDDWDLFNWVSPWWWDEDCDDAVRLALERELRRRHKHAKETGVWPGSVYDSKLKAPFPYERIGGHLFVVGDAKYGTLRSVGGEMHINGDAVFPRLECVGDTVSVIGKSKISFPKLKEIGNDLRLPFARGFDAPMLRYIGGSVFGTKEMFRLVREQVNKNRSKSRRKGR